MITHHTGIGFNDKSGEVQAYAQIDHAIGLVVFLDLNRELSKGRPIIEMAATQARELAAVLIAAAVDVERMA